MFWGPTPYSLCVRTKCSRCCERALTLHLLLAQKHGASVVACVQPFEASRKELLQLFSPFGQVRLAGLLFKVLGCLH